MSFENDQGEGSTIKLLYQYSKGTVKLDFKELFGHHKKVPKSQKFLISNI